MSSSNPFLRHPLSPASPPHAGLKEDASQSAFRPVKDTLPSPPYMSVATKSYASHSENNRYQDDMSQRPPRSPVNSFSPPPSRQVNGASASNNPLKRPLQPDEKERTDFKRPKVDGSGDRADGSTHIKATNHERLSDASNMQDQASALDSALPARATNEDAQTSSEPTFPMQDDSKSSGLFLVGRSARTRPGVDLNSHLLGTYGLGDLVKNMARLDPQTGEKINKLRKSYEGQIKMFGLPGRNKTHKSAKDEDGLLPLRKLVTEDDAAWEVRHGKRKIEVTAGMRAVMGRALQLHSGRMGKVQDEWDEILGHDSKKPVQPLHAPHPSQPVRPPLQNGVRPQHATGLGIDKMKTRGKKRSYDDSSFYGYTGFEAGASDVEDGHSDHDYNAPRKRKKE